MALGDAQLTGDGASGFLRGRRPRAAMIWRSARRSTAGRQPSLTHPALRPWRHTWIGRLRDFGDLVSRDRGLDRGSLVCRERRRGLLTTRASRWRRLAFGTRALGFGSCAFLFAVGFGSCAFYRAIEHEQGMRCGTRLLEGSKPTPPEGSVRETS